MSSFWGGEDLNNRWTMANGSIITPRPNNKCAQIAQSVEQGIENPCVVGSIPTLGTI